MSEAMMVKYESSKGEVTLTAEDVKKYLCRGGGSLTDAELKLFIELCKYQKLNPYIGECYPIKYGNDFQMVVGYETYKRRAEENPAYIGKKSGIVVLRGDTVINKEGTCLYPNEILIGGWCRITRERRSKETDVYTEVNLKEYDKGQANWKTKPATMIEKVAVSQALRAAFPVDYEGLYTAEEMPAIGADDSIKPNFSEDIKPKANEDRIITQAERQTLFATATEVLGKEDALTVLKKLLADYGVESTVKMPLSVYGKIMDSIEEIARIQDEDVVEEPENIELSAESAE